MDNSRNARSHAETSMHIYGTAMPNIVHRVVDKREIQRFVFTDYAHIFYLKTCISSAMFSVQNRVVVVRHASIFFEIDSNPRVKVTADSGCKADTRKSS